MYITGSVVVNPHSSENTEFIKDMADYYMNGNVKTDYYARCQLNVFVKQFPEFAKRFADDSQYRTTV